MKQTILILTFSLISLKSWAELPQSFVRAIWTVETGRREGTIYGDNRRALGPLQIHKSYWQDSGVEGSYNQVTNLVYASKVMEAYLRRYCPKAVKSNNFEIMARTHNGGWNGANKIATKNYWEKVKIHLYKADIKP